MSDLRSPDRAVAIEAPPTRPTSDGVSAGIAGVLLGVAGIMFAYGEVFPDAAAISLVLAGLAVWASRSTSHGIRWAIACLLTIFVAINLAYAIGDLSHPESPAPFISTAVVIGCGVVTIVLAVLAARGRPARGRRVWVVVGLALLAVAGASLLAAASVEEDERRPGDVEVVAEDIAFPAEVTVGTDTDAIFVRNLDRVRHTLVVDGEAGPVELPANRDVRIELDLEPGTYRFFCDIPGHEAMTGTLIVE